jgi:hypothetical protein
MQTQMLHESVISLTEIEKTQSRIFSVGRVTIILHDLNRTGDFLQFEGNVDMSALLVVRAKCSNLELVSSALNSDPKTMAMQFGRSRLLFNTCHQAASNLCLSCN